MLAHVLEDYGWTFVNKHDPALYWRKVGLTWGGQGLIIGALFLAIWAVQAVKERLT
jgi:hypothetical protein